jgi:flagellar motor switch protein FliM
VKKGLEAEHYAADVSADGEQSRAMATELDYDLVVLDLNMPRLDGVTVLRYLRTKKPSVPVLVLTGRTRVEDRVQCLDLGADDYLVKPFSFTELSARIRALLRRSHLPAESVLAVDDLKLDRVERKVERSGKRIELTSKEFALLEYLMRNAGRRITRAMIIEHVWNLSFDTCTNVVDVYVNYLRIGFNAALVSAEHLTFSEFLQRIPEVTYLASLKLEPMAAVGLLQLDLSVAFPLIDVLLGGEGKGAPPSREITEIEEQIIETVVRIICRELQIAWQAMTLEFQFEQRQQPQQVQQLMPAEEKTLSMSFEITVAESRGTMNLVVPAVVSNALLRKLSVGWATAKRKARADSNQRLQSRVLACKFQAELCMNTVAVSLRELSALGPGDLLVLKRRIDLAGALVVAGQDMFHANVARHGQQRAAKLLDRCPPPESGRKIVQ